MKIRKIDYGSYMVTDATYEEIKDACKTMSLSKNGDTWYEHILYNIPEDRYDLSVYLFKSGYEVTLINRRTQDVLYASGKGNILWPRD